MELQFKLKNNKFFSKINASTEPECVNSCRADVEHTETMSPTSYEPSIGQGNNLYTSRKQRGWYDRNKHKESNKMEANTEEHKAGQEKQESHMKENCQVPNESSYSPKRSHMISVQT